MPRARKPRTGSSTAESTAAAPPLAHPDRSGPGVDQQTLFKIAEQRQLFQQAAAREKQNGIKSKTIRVGREDDAESSSGSESDGDDDVPTLSPAAERILEAMLWTVSLATLHFTFDVLVQHQYGTEIYWLQIVQRAFSAWAGSSSPIPNQRNHYCICQKLIE